MDKITTLHIGTTKTGSTSIQSFLAQNRAVFAQNSVLYPLSLGLVNHNVIPAILPGKMDGSGFQKKYGINTHDDYAAFETDRTAMLIAEINDHTPDHIIISSEHMHSRCYNDTHFTQLKKFLAPALTDRHLRIVVYLRPQISHIISLYSTRVRHGATETINDFITNRMSGRRHAYFNFRRLLNQWQTAFPEAQLDVRRFNQMGTLDYGVLSDFLDAINITQFSKTAVFEPRQNKSMGAWQIEVLRLFNQLDKPLSKQLDRTTRHWLRHDMPKDNVLPTEDIARVFQDSFAKSNAWVCKTYFNNDKNALNIDWSIYSKMRNDHGLTPDRFVDLISTIDT